MLLVNDVRSVIRTPTTAQECRAPKPLRFLAIAKSVVLQG